MMSSQCPDYLDPGKRMVSFQCSFFCHPSDYFFVIRVADTGMALLHRSSEKNWQLLTKFIINSHLTVEEKICHKK
ncbi:hypothetical protein [Wolbachia endosymbiont of Psylliodes chrysocephala]|uniref:hypothetical protein n=1 Tax=Wolbachia endosymbiont of Psylliodes chrysocephala TaxID=2883236 RepID=UPI00209E9807|nr:hypothetical protein [Wolbachia endosymbiont of Psylliodes chrysocephala]